jgi:cytochrome o ubiquinol oxidase operon protein cyoD
MSQVSWDHAPGDMPAAEESGSSGLLVYTIGLLLAAVLTATSFWIANTHMLWGPGTPLGLAVLAIAQMGVHLVFFLHITSGPDNTNNTLALAFGVLVVTLIVTGSLVIVDDLKMMPGGAMNAPAPN